MIADLPDGRPRILFFAALLLAAGPPCRAQIAPLDLTQCYELAKKQSESLMISAEQIDQIEQQYKELLGSVLPNLSFFASEKYQQYSAASAEFAPPVSPQVNFVLTQPLFSGFREYATMRSYKHQKEQARLLLEYADRQLFLNVANAFYMVLSLEKNLSDTEALRDYTEDRAKELREREQLGKSRDSEVLTVEAQRAAILSSIEGIKGQVAAARELLSFLIGEDASGAELQDKLPDAPDAGTQDAVVQKAEDRSDVRAAREAEQASREQVNVAQGGRYPTLGLVGDYYLARIPFYEPIHWDLSFNLNVPLFSGGTISAQVRQAQSAWRAAQDSERLAVRQARTQIRTAYVALSAALAQARTLGEAYDKSSRSYRLQTEEYRLGIVDNLTVNQGLNDMQNAKLTMDQTAIQIKIDYLQLKVATEELP